MDTNTLRAEILRLTAQHEETGAGSYLNDTAFAAAIGEPLADVQRQIRISEDSGLLDVAAAFGPSYGVRLTPKSELAVEQSSEPGAAPKAPTGF